MFPELGRKEWTKQARKKWKDREREGRKWKANFLVTLALHRRIGVSFFVAGAVFRPRLALVQLMYSVIFDVWSYLIVCLIHEIIMLFDPFSNSFWSPTLLNELHFSHILPSLLDLRDLNAGVENPGTRWAKHVFEWNVWDLMKFVTI